MFVPTVSWRLLGITILLASAILLPVRAMDTPAKEGTSAKNAAPRARTFLFTYSATVTGLPVDKAARIWTPVAPSNEEQQVKMVSKDLPAEEQIGTEPTYGNQVLYVEAKPTADGTIYLATTYRVTRQEVKGDLNKRAADD